LANLIGIVGSTREIREKYLASIRPRLLIFDWLRYESADLVNGVVAWAAIPSAPSDNSALEGGQTFVIGSLYREKTMCPSDADFIMRMVVNGDREAVSGQNGYYMAITMVSNQRPRRALIRYVSVA
jgi:hypothetical protein